MSELGSAPVPAPGDEDHVRGPADAPLLIEYADYECPFCAALHARAALRGFRVIFRHFPVRSSHPRAWPAAAAAEAAGLQGAFWPMHDALMADQARLEDPHLWDRARALGLDLERFDADRRWSRCWRGSRPTSTAGSGPAWSPPRRCFAGPGAAAERVDPADLG